MAFDRHLPVFDAVSSNVADALDAVHHEAAATGLAPTDPIHVDGGRLLKTIGATSLWSFAAQLDDTLLIGSRGQLRTASTHDPIAIELVAVGDNDIVVSTRELLPDTGDDIEPAGTITFTPAGVLGALEKRLESYLGNPDIEHGLAIELLFPDKGEWIVEEEPDPDPTTIMQQADNDQATAARRAVEPGVRFTWGPPGTGKTTVLANAVANAVMAGQKVLVLSHSNVAVDVAMVRTAQVLEAEHDLVSEHRVLRVGTRASTRSPNAPTSCPRPSQCRNSPTVIVR